LTAGPPAGKPPRLVVFDLDGTLIDSSRDLAAAVNAALRQVAAGTPALSDDEVRTFVGDGARVLVARSLARAGLPHSVDEVLPVFLESYRGRLLETTRLFPGVAEALDALRGETLAVLSNKPGDMSRAILAGLGIASRFRSVLGAGDVPARKPDPAGLQRLMADTGTSPARTAIVGDSAVDVLTGRAAGVVTIGVTYGFAPETLRATAPVVLVDDARELPAALDRAFTAD
jgi:phosphoglycolate phosphatase